MLSYQDQFTMRQTMNAADFEFYHYLDKEPPTVDFHHHNFYEVFFFISGNVNYTVEGRSYQLRPGDILLTTTRDIHRPEVSPGKPYERYVLWVNEGFFQQIQCGNDDLSACFVDAAQKQYRLIRPDGDMYVKLQKLCRRILSLQREDVFGSKTLLQTTVTDFLVFLNRAYFDTPSDIRQDVTENDAINQVVDYIENHLCEELTLDLLSSNFHLSKYHLDRQFKKYTGLTIYQFIIKKRLITAKAMICAGQSVTDACTLCGFGDYSNFLKAFKREFNHHPKDFKPVQT